MALDRNSQIAAKIEQVPGTAVTVAAANAKFQIIAPTLALDPQLYERRILRGTITKDFGLMGTKMGRLSFGVELTGHSDGASEPNWSLLMRACGWRAVAINKYTIGAVTSGPFRHGETLSDPTPDTATCIFDTYNGETTLYVTDLSVAAASFTGAITGGTSGASATISASGGAAGWAWYPISRDTVFLDYSSAGTLTGSLPVGTIVQGNTSGAKGIIVKHNTTAKTLRIRRYGATEFALAGAETIQEVGVAGNNATACVAAASTYQEDIPTITLAFYQDGSRVVLDGCRGTWSLNAKTGEAAIMQFEFLGSFDSQGDVAPLTGVTFQDKIPAVLLGATTTLGAEGDTALTSDYPPRWSTLTLKLDNTLAALSDATATNGVRCVHISNRNPNGTLDPEMDLEANYAFRAKMMAGSIARGRFQVGSSLGNKFLIHVPGMQFRSESTPEDAGYLRRNLSFDCTGGYYTNASNTPGVDNEIIMALIDA